MGRLASEAIKKEEEEEEKEVIGLGLLARSQDVQAKVNSCEAIGDLGGGGIARQNNYAVKRQRFFLLNLTILRTCHLKEMSISLIERLANLIA